VGNAADLSPSVNTGMLDPEASAVQKFKWRMIPLLAVCYFVYRLDLLNVGFAGLTMRKDLDLSASAFGFGVGVFYWGFFLCQVPSNLMLEKVGARRWLPIIMLAWSVLSGCMALVNSQHSFYIMRFILGGADAGFFPGVIYYIGCWSPAAHRGRMIGMFNIGGLIAPILGGPIAVNILRLDGVLGIEGWRWLFICEAIPAVILTVVLAAMVVDRPAKARWLTPAERDALQAALDAEARKRAALGTYTLRQAVTNPRIIALCFTYLGILGSMSAFSFFLPIMFQQLGLSNQQIGLASAIPYVVACIALMLVTRHSDLKGERIYHVAVSILIACVGILLAGWWSHDATLLIVAICIAIAGGQSALAVFWSLPATFLSGAAAAASVALINAVGNLGGYFGPQIMGLFRDWTGDFSLGITVMAGWSILAAVLVVALGRSPGMKATLDSARAGTAK